MDYEQGAEDQNVKQYKHHTADKKLASISPRKLQVASRNYHRHRVPHTRKNRERAQLSGQSGHGLCVWARVCWCVRVEIASVSLSLSHAPADKGLRMSPKLPQ